MQVRCYYFHSLTFISHFSRISFLSVSFLSPTSAVFAMPEGRMLTYFKIVPPGSWLDVPNAVLGLIYYHIVLLFSNILPSQLIFAISVGAMSASVFLAVRLVQLNELCILCWTTHIINTTLLVYFGRRVWAEGEICVVTKKNP